MYSSLGAIESFIPTPPKRNPFYDLVSVEVNNHLVVTDLRYMQRLSFSEIDLPPPHHLQHREELLFRLLFVIGAFMAEGGALIPGETYYLLPKCTLPRYRGHGRPVGGQTRGGRIQ